MSKQLAISSTFCTFALAAMAVLNMPTYDGSRGGNAFMAVQTEAPALNLPVPSFFAD